MDVYRSEKIARKHLPDDVNSRFTLNDFIQIINMELVQAEQEVENLKYKAPTAYSKGKRNILKRLLRIVEEQHNEY